MFKSKEEKRKQLIIIFQNILKYEDDEKVRFYLKLLKEVEKNGTD